MRVPASTIIPFQSQAPGLANASVVRTPDATSRGVSLTCYQLSPESTAPVGDQMLRQMAAAQADHLETNPPKVQYKPVKGDVVITGAAASRFVESIQTVDAVCEGQVCSSDAPCAFDVSVESQKNLEVAKTKSFSGACGFPLLGDDQLNRNQIMLTVRQPPCLSPPIAVLISTSSFNNSYRQVASTTGMRLLTWLSTRKT